MKWAVPMLFLLAFPFITQASVYISEVAWMGSSESANYEWIELHNDGTSQDVTGWELTDGMNLSISLSGVIQSNSYSVLERTSDASAPGTAFLIYVGALVNSGAVLQLKREDGSLVDQVNGGDDWKSIGGDNVTKETAQYTNSGWVTAPSTPGVGLVWDEDDSTEDSQTNENADTDVSGSSKLAKPVSHETVRLVVPDVTLDLEIDGQTVGYVNQLIDFSVKPTGIGDTLIDSLVYEWNFGDGLTSSKEETSHIFSFPGTYVVTVYGGYKRQEQVARHEITILPINVALTKNKSGDIQINNDSPYEIDVSGYRLRGDKVFVFPPRSILLPKQTITLSKNKLGDTDSKIIAIYDTEGVLLDSIVPYVVTSNTEQDSYSMQPEPQISSITTSRQTAPEASGNFIFSSSEVGLDKKTEEMMTPEKGIENSYVEEPIHLASAASSLPEKSWPYLVMVGLLALGTLGVYIKPKSN
jgi:hypothetical protein